MKIRVLKNSLLALLVFWGVLLVLAPVFVLFGLDTQGDLPTGIYLKIPLIVMLFIVTISLGRWLHKRDGLIAVFIFSVFFILSTSWIDNTSSSYNNFFVLVGIATFFIVIFLGIMDKWFKEYKDKETIVEKTH